MSEQQAPVPAIEIPSEVQSLQQQLQAFNDMHRATVNGMFPGAASEAVSGLKAHLKECYGQIFTQFDNHPWVLEQKAKEQAAKEAEAAAQAE